MAVWCRWRRNRARRRESSSSQNVDQPHESDSEPEQVGPSGIRRRLPVQTTDPLSATIRPGGIQSSKPLPIDSIRPGDVAIGIAFQVIWFAACYFVYKRYLRTRKPMVSYLG